MVYQISVFLENRAGQLAEITGLLAGSGIDLRAINIAETADYGILRLIVSDAAKASSILLDNGFILSMTPVVAVSVPDQPGGLASVLKLLPEAGIDVEYMYSIFGQVDGLAHMIFRVADAEKLVSVLEANGIQTIDADHLGIKSV